MHEVVKNGIMFGAVFSLLLGVGYTLRPTRLISTFFVAAISVSTSVLMFYGYFLFSQIRFEVGLFNHIYVPFVYVLGPGMYAAFQGILLEDYKLTWERYTFLPGALLLVLFPVLYLVDDSFFSRPTSEYFFGAPAGVGDILAVIGFAWNAAFYILTMMRAAGIFTLQSIMRDWTIQALGVILFGSGLVTIGLLFSFLMRWIEGLFSAALATSVLGAVGYVVGQRTPGMFQDLIPGVRKAYRGSRLAGVDLEAVRSTLAALMKEECIYRDEELSLARLADMVNIKDYQLSEYLNSHCGMNFSKYVNSFRVEEAAAILKSERTASVLSVAFRVGFNSKANFNLAFKGFTGLSPRDYLHRELGPRPRKGR
ncbi:MAG: AraC family transcriptional regulator [Spirochaetia bacterium]|nr:AraC family transcriptional regulator [Spirochaetia bacterium]